MRGAAIFLLAGTAAGCSGQMSRFNSSDDLFTSSTSSQPPASVQNQPFPGDVAAAPMSGTVSRGSLPPVGGASQQASMAPQQAPALAPLSSPRSNASQGNETFGQQNVAAAPVQAAPALAPAQNNSTNTAPGRGAPAQNLGVLPVAPKPTAPNSQASAGTAGGGYKVQPGDTLSKISRNTGVSVDALKSANNMQDGNIRIGQTLVVPGAGSQAVASAAPAALKPAAQPVVAAAPQPAAPQQPAQAATAQGYTPPKQPEKVIQQASLSQEEAPDATGIGKMRWPVRGRVISKFGSGGGKTSDGIDIAVPEGTSVRSAENGVVIYAGDGLKEFGNTVLVRHEDGLVTVYGHASALKVSRGDTVKRGQEIALSGMSGSTDSPKLHFEVRKNSSPVDPTGYLQ